jgi:hypothetical protein
MLSSYVESTSVLYFFTKLRATVLGVHLGTRDVKARDDGEVTASSPLLPLLFHTALACSVTSRLSDHPVACLFHMSKYGSYNRTRGRCRFYDDDGQGLPGGCPWDECRFAHPSDSDWQFARPWDPSKV